MEALTIGKLARRAGVGVETVRFYERKGLLETPPRQASGYRQFGEEAVDKLRFIRRAKELGFSLKEIKDLLRLGTEDGATCGQVKERAERKIADIEERIRSLRRIKAALEKVTKQCSGCGPATDCPILKAFDRCG